jgi:hypothetical protein
MPFMTLFVVGVITVADNIWKLFYTGYHSEKFLSQLYQSVSCCVGKCHTTRPLMTSASGTAVFFTQYSFSPPPTLPFPPLQLISFYMVHPLKKSFHRVCTTTLPYSRILLDASYVTGSMHGCLHNLHHLSFISNSSIP